ncbi:uncharacterized protein LOC106093255 [Stomoxys calcitrans]|uniref:uncharacterized protein LOC106093255 n=1 Tax=Stomoxys calcitrans TaxID=35570 RepID=UPI0027E397D8|nr:uncharacterized protein LOC106093255 [Stomoxys calcitrans]XP_013115757.2 uncharacterized protein LOC106093255 [Stomoxys calcitrans]XP_013115758.2 uncharacterized protein LOC106093255 [Stomoxys calcitrans]
MLLNSYGQPTILKDDETNASSLEWRDAPMILCHKDSIFERYFPKYWKGTLYSSEAIINSVIQSNDQVPWTVPYKSIPLLPSEVFNITLKGGNKIKLTMIPLFENMMFIIEDEYVKSIVTDNLTPKDLYHLTHQKIARDRINEGIDVLYINDAAYQELEKNDKNPSKVLLRSIAHTVQPAFIKGYFNNPLPQSLLDCCSTHN